MKRTHFFQVLVLGLTVLAASIPARAHEFWFEPIMQPLKVGATADLNLQVGEFFEGVLVGFSAAQTASLKHIGPSGATTTTTTTRDLTGLVPAQPVANFKLPLSTPGTHLIAFDSQPSEIELPAGQFHAYLHDEGLDFIKARREAAGTAEKPGRERYRRNVKTLLAVGNAAGQAVPVAGDKIYTTRVGQRLELIPLNDPLRLAAGGALGLQLLFEGKPLEGALVKAWHKQSSQTLIIRAITTAKGEVKFNLPYSGAWMVSVVHMVPAVGAKNIDWDSLWANLSFVMPERPQRR